jgi:hypothetical protein
MPCWYFLLILREQKAHRPIAQSVERQLSMRRCGLDRTSRPSVPELAHQRVVAAARGSPAMIRL